MSQAETSPALRAGETHTRALQEALKPHLRAAGARRLERLLGKSPRYFQNARYRGSLRMVDYLSVCMALELDPGKLLSAALRGEFAPEVRPPRVVSTAWKRFERGGEGLPRERIDALESAVQTTPRKTRAALRRSLVVASREQVPELLGLYGSCLRVESKLSHAELSLLAAFDMAERAKLESLLSELLIRRSYVALELAHPQRALSLAEAAILASARLGDREGEGRGFLTCGIFRSYMEDYPQALRDFVVALERCLAPRRLIAAHHGSAVCLLALGRQREARSAAMRARQLAPAADPWMRGNLSWFEARLAHGSERLRHLLAARDELCPQRPADCALVTVEIIEAGLAQGEGALVEDHVLSLCALLEKTANPRVDKAITQLIRQRSSLTPELVARIRQALERTRDDRPISVPRAEL